MDLIAVKVMTVKLIYFSLMEKNYFLYILPYNSWQDCFNFRRNNLILLNKSVIRYIFYYTL